MDKKEPQDRWRDHVMERYLVFKLDGGWKQLRKEALQLLDRKTIYDLDEWWNSFTIRVNTPGYIDWALKCEDHGKRFGLGRDVVIMQCLFKNFRPDIYQRYFKMEAHSLNLTIVTDSDNDEFIQRLCYEAQQMNVHVVRVDGSLQFPVVNMDDQYTDLPPADFSGVPDAKFIVRIEIPPGYPSGGVQELSKAAKRVELILSQKLGIPFKQRLRTSKLVKKAAHLRVGKKRLNRGEAYEIVDQIYPNQGKSYPEDRRRHKRVVTQRHQLRKRLKPLDTSKEA